MEHLEKQIKIENRNRDMDDLCFIDGKGRVLST